MRNIVPDVSNFGEESFRRDILFLLNIASGKSSYSSDFWGSTEEKPIFEDIFPMKHSLVEKYSVSASHAETLKKAFEKIGLKK